LLKLNIEIFRQLL